MMQKMACALGFHGPGIYAAPFVGPSSHMTGGFERTCPHCGSVWEGGVEDVRRNGVWITTFGPWKYVGKSAIAKAEGKA